MSINKRGSAYKNQERKKSLKSKIQDKTKTKDQDEQIYRKQVSLGIGCIPPLSCYQNNSIFNKFTDITHVIEKSAGKTESLLGHKVKGSQRSTPKVQREIQ